MIRRRTFLGGCLAGSIATVLAYLLHSTKFFNKSSINPVLTNFSTNGFNINTVSQLLWAAQGITLHPFRSVPSAGGIYPLEVYVIIGHTVDEMEEGVYHYYPEGHTLNQILTGDQRAQLAQAFNSKTSPLVEQAPISIIITAVYERTMNRYGARGIRYVHLEIGHVIQNILLQATSLGLATAYLPIFDVDKIIDLLNTPDPLLVITTTKSSQIDIKRIQESNIALTYPISLPTVDTTGIMSVEEAITRRRSIRAYTAEAIPLEKLSKILWAALGARNPETNELAFVSFSGINHVEINIIVSRVMGLEGGVYRYFTKHHSLELIREGEYVNTLAIAGLEQPWIQEAPVNFVISTNYQQVQETFGEFGERLALFEVGQVAENIYLEAQTLNLGTVVIGAFHDSEVHSIVNLRRGQSPIYIMPLGPIIDEKSRNKRI